VVTFAIRVIYATMIFWCYLEPSNFALFHGEECDSDVVMSLHIVHLEFFLGLSLLLEIAKLSVVKSCLMVIVYGIFSFAESVELSRWFLLDIFDEATVLILCDVDWFTYVLKI